MKRAFFSWFFAAINLVIFITGMLISWLSIAGFSILWLIQYYL